MKSLTHLAIALLVLLAAGSCNRHASTLEPFGWSRIDPTFDSLTVAAEHYYFVPVEPELVVAVADTMAAVAAMLDGDAGRLAQAYSTFWKAYSGYALRDEDILLTALDSADVLNSTLNDKYLGRRISDFRMWTGDYSSHETFQHLLESLDYYRSIGDDPSEGNIALLISNSLVMTDVPELSLLYLNIADSLYKASGMYERLVNLKLNRIMLLGLSGCSDEAEQGFREALADSALMASPLNRDLVYRNHYYFFKDEESIVNAYRNIKDFIIDLTGDFDSPSESLGGARGVYEALLAEQFMNKNMPDSAAFYMALAERHIPEVQLNQFLVEIYRVKAMYLERQGRYADALHAYLDYNAMRDSVHDTERPENKIYFENVTTLHRHQAESAEALRQQKSRTHAIVGLLVILALAALVVAQKLRSRHRLRMMEMELEAERKERRLLAMSLSQEESAKMLSYVKDEVARMSRSGSVSGTEIKKIETSVRLHQAGQGEIETFAKTFADIKPDFASRLRELAPDLSENNIRFCSYLSLGMTNQEIANVMHIKAASLRQARLRLRQKFGLTKDDSLEDFLRKIAF